MKDKLQSNIVNMKTIFFHAGKHREKVKLLLKRKDIFLSALFIFIWLGFSLTDNVFSEEIKISGGIIVSGEVVEVNEEALSVKDGLGQLHSIKWSGVSLISRDKEMIVVTKDGGKKTFSVLTNSSATLSARDTNLKVTDKLSDIFPVEKIVASTSSIQVAEQAAGEGKKTAQSAVVTEPVKPPQKTWKAHIDAGATVQSGNTDATTATLKGGYANERKKDNIYFDTLALYQENDSDLVANEQRATGKYEYKHTPRLYSFFNQYFEHDDIEHLNYRSISSPGAGYRFIEKELMKYRAEAGPAYTYEKYWLNPGTDHVTNDSMGIRVGQYFDWQFLPTTKFYAKNEFVQSVENKDDWWSSSGVGLRQNITKTVSFNFDWLNIYDNTPGEGNKRSDTTIIGTVGYNF